MIIYFLSLFDKIKYSLLEFECLAALPPRKSSSSIGVIIPIDQASSCLLIALTKYVKNYL
jgi:hypothetical protein